MATVPAFPDFIDGQYVTEDDLDAIKIAGAFLMSPPSVCVYNTPGAPGAPNSGIATGVWSPVNFTNTLWNRGPLWAGGLPTRLVASHAGLYRLTGYGQFDTGTTGVRQARWLKNGADVYGIEVTRNPTTPTDGARSMTVVPPPMTVALAVGDYIELQLAQTSGAPFYLGPASATMEWVGVKP